VAQIQCDHPGHSCRVFREPVSRVAVLSLPTRIVSNAYQQLIVPHMSGRVLKTVPNPAHYALSRLSIPSIRQKIAPNSELTHVTQNIDGLLTRALNETAAACGLHSPPVEIIEMHGRLFDVVCTAHDCDFHETNYDSPICPALGGTETVMQSEVPEPIVRRADLPHCPACGQLCRPGVVWFGERPNRIEDVLALADDADLCVIVGTSALVCLHLGIYLIVSDYSFVII